MCHNNGGTMTREARLYIPSSLAVQLPAAVRNALARLPAERQHEFLEYYKRRAKKLSTAYLLWLLTLHYAYLGRWGTQILFWSTLGGFSVWWVVDFFRIRRMIARYNEEIAMAVMRDIAIISRA